MSNQDLLNLLLGEWSGTGRGDFPTIEPFEYLETLVFSADGRPFLHYEQKTKRRNEGGPIMSLRTGRADLSVCCQMKRWNLSTHKAVGGWSKQ
jgi:hypothetical protein